MPKQAKGTNRDSFDSRDLIYRPALLKSLHPELLPEWTGIKVLDQQQEGACTGFGLAATINYLLHQRGGRERVSARMLFETAKRYDQWPGNKYDWSSARGAMKGWYKHGVCAEPVWPSGDPRDVDLTLDRQTDALKRPLGVYYRVLPRRTDMQCALSEVGVVFAAAATHDGWSKPKAGVIPLSRSGDATGHAFCIVGYVDKGFVVQNSWGSNWGGVTLGGKPRRGLAIWTYEDFERNAWDLWVATLALPVDSLQALRSEYTVGNQGSRRSESGPPPAEVNRHVIHIDDGQFDSRSEYATTLASAKQLIDDKVAAAAQRGELNLLLHAHGGLNTVDGAAKRARAWRDVIDKNGVEHVHWIWETGFLAELKDVIFGKDKFADGRAGGAGDWKDKILESTTSPVSKPLWREMKSDAVVAFDAQKAGAEVLALFGQALAATPGIAKKRITLSAHSAGAIWVGETLRAWQRLEPNFVIDHVVLLAPACREDYFRASIAPHVIAGRVAMLTIFQLTDELERDDDVATVYGKSLLYYVSNACEDPEGATPLLGMQKFNAQWQDLRAQMGPRLTLYTATVDQANCRATSHAGFDSDVNTMNTLLQLAAGKPLARPFTEADLKAG
ncbi:MAG TPA: C1 family peptidase [Burkholderiaceae bacterium]|nr:C1 family peptidase [Burkholderiaceae bacterium]